MSMHPDVHAYNRLFIHYRKRASILILIALAFMPLRVVGTNVVHAKAPSLPIAHGQRFALRKNNESGDLVAVVVDSKTTLCTRAHCYDIPDYVHSLHDVQTWIGQMRGNRAMNGQLFSPKKSGASTRMYKHGDGVGVLDNDRYALRYLHLEGKRAVLQTNKGRTFLIPLQIEAANDRDELRLFAKSVVQDQHIRASELYVTTQGVAELVVQSTVSRAMERTGINLGNDVEYTLILERLKKWRNHFMPGTSLLLRITNKSLADELSAFDAYLKTFESLLHQDVSRVAANAVLLNVLITLQKIGDTLETTELDNRQTMNKLIEITNHLSVVIASAGAGIPGGVGISIATRVYDKVTGSNFIKTPFLEDAVHIVSVVGALKLADWAHHFVPGVLEKISPIISNLPLKIIEKLNTEITKKAGKFTLVSSIHLLTAVFAEVTTQVSLDTLKNKSPYLIARGAALASHGAVAGSSLSIFISSLISATTKVPQQEIEVMYDALESVSTKLGVHLIVESTHAPNEAHASNLRLSSMDESMHNNHEQKRHRGEKRSLTIFDVMKIQHKWGIPIQNMYEQYFSKKSMNFVLRLQSLAARNDAQVGHEQALPKSGWISNESEAATAFATIVQKIKDPNKKKEIIHFLLSK
ncbi:MAG: hypothetical protein KGO83_00110 [Paenibacillaceae bacterium]|nr:hypothetical protein [Paenibacillaceae bacterium]